MCGGAHLFYVSAFGPLLFLFLRYFGAVAAAAAYPAPLGFAPPQSTYERLCVCVCMTRRLTLFLFLFFLFHFLPTQLDLELESKSEKREEKKTKLNSAQVDDRTDLNRVKLRT